jgi:hypothetical protein
LQFETAQRVTNTEDMKNIEAGGINRRAASWTMERQYARLNKILVLSSHIVNYFKRTEIHLNCIYFIAPGLTISGAHARTHTDIHLLRNSFVIQSLIAILLAFFAAAAMNLKWAFGSLVAFLGN